MSELDELKKHTKLLKWLVRHEMSKYQRRYKDSDVEDVVK